MTCHAASPKVQGAKERSLALREAKDAFCEFRAKAVDELRDCVT